MYAKKLNAGQIAQLMDCSSSALAMSEALAGIKESNHPKFGYGFDVENPNHWRKQLAAMFRHCLELLEPDRN